MRNAEKKFCTQNSHNWISAVKFAETRRKLRPVPTNANLYHYAGNNPVKYTDPDGREAGDEFDTIDDAAKDWAKTYADDSIALNCEFASTIYSFETKDSQTRKRVTRYSYNVPNRGRVKTSSPNEELKKGQNAVSAIHSHGSVIPGYDDDNPSTTDIAAARENQWTEYAVTPYGNLKSIDKNGIITVILSDLKKDACINDDGSISFEDKERLKNNYIYKRDKYK